MADRQTADGPLSKLTERESEILRAAGERVFTLSRRLAETEKQSDQLRTETQSLRELLAESREVRKVLTDQISALQRELDREYEERSELRRLLASLHMQMQDLLPVVTRLAEAQRGALAPALSAGHDQPSERIANGHQDSSLARRLMAASSLVTGSGARKKGRGRR